MRTKEERRAALIGKFKEVAAERVGKLSRLWLKLEQTPSDAAAAGELLREIHTLKGEAKTVGFPEISVLSHRLESLLLFAQGQGFAVNRSSSDLVLRAVDRLSAMLRDEADQGALEELLVALDVGAAQGGTDAPVHAAVAPSGKADAPRFGGEAALRVRVERIASISDVTGELLVEQSKAAFSVARLREELGRLEAVAEACGDVTAAARLRERVTSLAGQLGALDETTYRQGLHLQELDRTVRELRLVPVASLLEPYTRMVRDLAAEQGKDAALEIQGGEHEADKRVLEVLEEPLLHALRNCVDHGIEAPEVRAAAGKPARGRVSLEVAQRGSALSITVSDDGAGIDPERVRRKAVTANLLSAANAEALSPGEAVNLVFLPGLSTTEQATMLSGRGVGMDVVKQRVEQLGGRVTLESVVGKGIRLSMVVPSTISMTRALVFALGGTSFALPSVSIDTIVHLAGVAPRPSAQGPVIEHAGGLVPVRPLAELLGTRAEAEPAQYGLVVRSGMERCVLAVTSAGREVDLVVKALGAPLRDYPLVAGAAVLESGELGLMLDVGQLLRRRSAAPGGPVPAAPRQARRQFQAKVLLVEDSVIFRATIGSLLSALGCSVQVAEDGERGLAALASYTPDLVVTDVQMPNLDGLEMTRRIRQEPRWAKLPVVMLSTLGSAADKRRGVEAGASAYLVKSELDENNVSEVLARFLA